MKKNICNNCNYYNNLYNLLISNEEYIINYIQLFKIKKVKNKIQLLINEKWDLILEHINIFDNSIKLLDNKTIIIDEAHRLRNTGSIAKRIMKATKNIARILLLTGTPMVNGPDDFSNMANLIFGDRIIPSTQKGFNEKFYKAKSKNMPPEKDRCLLYSVVTCTDGGRKKDSKSKYCKYHQYMHDKRLPAKKKKGN